MSFDPEQYRERISLLTLAIGSNLYSARKVIDGSTRDARHAGAEHAIADTLTSMTTTPVQAMGSRGDVPKRRVLIP